MRKTFWEEEKAAGEDFSHDDGVDYCDGCWREGYPGQPLDSCDAHKACVGCGKHLDKSKIDADGYCAGCVEVNP
jgi:hypothetical protein